MIPHQPPWMETCWDWLGIQEDTRPGKSNPQIEAFHRSTGEEAPDDLAWCSSTVNALMLSVGIQGTMSKAGKSWESWGIGLVLPAYGCVVTLWYTSPDDWRRHVGIFLGFIDDDALVWGGNQRNEVSVRRYPRARITSYRWPK